MLRFPTIGKQNQDDQVVLECIINSRGQSELQSPYCMGENVYTHTHQEDQAGRGQASHLPGKVPEIRTLVFLLSTSWLDISAFLEN